MTEPYGPPGAEELFKFSLFLVLCNRLTSCAVAVGSLLVSTCAAAGGVGGWGSSAALAPQLLLHLTLIC